MTTPRSAGRVLAIMALAAVADLLALEVMT